MGAVGRDGIGGAVFSGAHGGRCGSDGVVPSLPSTGTVVHSFSGVETGRGGVGEQGRGGVGERDGGAGRGGVGERDRGGGRGSRSIQVWGGESESAYRLYIEGVST